MAIMITVCDTLISICIYRKFKQNIYLDVCVVLQHGVNTEEPCVD